MFAILAGKEIITYFSFLGSTVVINKFTKYYSTHDTFDPYDVRVISYNPWNEGGMLLITQTNVYSLKGDEIVQLTQGVSEAANFTDINFCATIDQVLVMDFNRHVVYILSDTGALTVYLGEEDNPEIEEGGQNQIRIQNPYSASCGESSISVFFNGDSSEYIQCLRYVPSRNSGVIEKYDFTAGIGFTREFPENSLNLLYLADKCAAWTRTPQTEIWKPISTCGYAHIAFLGPDLLIVKKTGDISKGVYNRQQEHFEINPEEIFVFSGYPWKNFYPKTVNNLDSPHQAVLHDPVLQEIITVKRSFRTRNRPATLTGKMSFIVNKGFTCGQSGLLLEGHTIETCAFKCIKLSNCEGFDYDRKGLCTLQQHLSHPLTTDNDKDCYVWESSLPKSTGD